MSSWDEVGSPRLLVNGMLDKKRPDLYFLTLDSYTVPGSGSTFVQCPYTVPDRGLRSVQVL